MSFDFLIKHRNQFKKVNLYKFISQNLPLYSVYELTEQDDSEGNPREYIIVKPNNFKKTDARSFLKIDKSDNSVEIKAQDYRFVNVEPDHVSGMDQYVDFESKFIFNGIENTARNVLNAILKIGVNYKIYNIKDVQSEVNFMLGFISKERSERDASVYLHHGALGGLSNPHKNDYSQFDIKTKSILNNNIEFNHLVHFRFPLSNERYCNIVIFHENGIEKVYSVENNVSTDVSEDCALNDYLKTVFEEEVYQSVYYKYGIERQPMTPEFWAMCEMAEI